MKGPQNESLESPIPEKTKVNSIQLKKNTICIDISEDFLKSSGTDSIYSIVNTLTEFNSNNTVLLDVAATKEKIASLAYINERLAEEV